MRTWYENQKMVFKTEVVDAPAAVVESLNRLSPAISTGESAQEYFAEISLNKLCGDGIAYPVLYKEVKLSLPEIRTAAYLDKESNTVYMSTIDVAGRQTVDPALLISGADRVSAYRELQRHTENVAFLTLLYAKIEASDSAAEFEEAVENAKEAIAKCESGDDIRLAIISLTELLQKEQQKFGMEMPEIFPPLNLGAVFNGAFGPSQVRSGKFVVFQTVKDIPKKVDREALKKEFILEPDRKFTKEEKMRMHPLPDFYEPSEMVLTVLSKIKKMWTLPPHQRLVNVLFEGPAGTGKTMDAKAMASLLGLPYAKITCSANMDESSFTEVMLPVANEDPIPIPSADEILFDPEGSYKTLTGKTCETVTDDMLKNAVKAAKTHNEKCGTVKYVNFPSDLVLAFEHGWLCEIQEPSCISDPGVMTVLNSALERGGQLNLAQRTITRHPSCIFVITTNPNYAGCRPINEAVRDRMQDAEDVQLPTDEEMVRRLEAYTGCKDRDFLFDLVEGMNSLNEELENEGIVSHVSLRGMSDFVLQVMCGFDAKTAMDSAIVNKITTDRETKAMIENFLDESTKIRRLSYEK
jgi:MoxR-like ATPase